MTTGSSSWVQALLLLSLAEPPGLDHLLAERRRAQTASGAQVSSEPASFDTPTTRESRETLAITYPGTSAPHLANLSAEQPFWPGARHPSACLLQALGNEVIVAALPAQVAFLLYCVCVVSGTGTPTFSWELSRLAGSGEVVPGAPVASSAPTPLHMRNLGNPATLGASTAPAVRVATVREPVQVTVEEQGLYGLTVRLNGESAGRLVLFVQLAPPKSS